MLIYGAFLAFSAQPLIVSLQSQEHDFRILTGKSLSDRLAYVSVAHGDALFILYTIGLRWLTFLYDKDEAIDAQHETKPWRLPKFNATHLHSRAQTELLF